jgi:Bacterial Ig-like domain (group 3)
MIAGDPAMKKTLLKSAFGGAIASLLGLSLVVVTAVVDAGQPTVSAATTSSPQEPGNSVSFVFNDATQYFTVPAGVTQVQITGWGGSGANGSGQPGNGPSAGGLGAQISATAGVAPGDVLVVMVGGQGETADSNAGGSGGLSSGDTMNGGNGGGIGDGGSGSPGGGGGGGTEVVDANTGAVILAAGGGGGGGGAGVTFDNGVTGPPAGAGGNAGDSNNDGGMSCDNSACVLGGSFASAFSPGGSSGEGTANDANGAAGGGGGGFYEAGVNGGGGTGGDASQDGNYNLGGGGGGAGLSYSSPYDTDVVFGDGPLGDGGVIVQWATPAPQVILTSSLNPSMVGSAVTFTATVSPLSGDGPAPTGTVQFVDTTTGLPVGLPQTLPGTSVDSVSTTVDDLSLGTHAVVASYMGDATYPAADSVLLEQVVQPLPPTIRMFTPDAGTVHQKVSVLGSNLSSLSSVAFDGTPARVLTDTTAEVTVRVPPGAHSGVIQITTAGGTATSTKRFRVLP